MAKDGLGDGGLGKRNLRWSTEVSSDSTCVVSIRIQGKLPAPSRCCVPPDSAGQREVVSLACVALQICLETQLCHGEFSSLLVCY